MTKVMMMWGGFPFMLATAAFQELKRQTRYRWQQQDRIARKPAQQYLGPAADEITLQGEILPHWRGSTGQLELMRLQAKLGKPLPLIQGHGGFVLGLWVVTSIDEAKSELMADGTPRLINFSITMREYGADQVSDLASVFGAISAVGRLL